MNRKTPFVNNEHYHLYNRGIDKRNIFSNQKDINRFFQSMIEFNGIDPIGSIYEKTYFPKHHNTFGGETSKKSKSKKYDVKTNKNKLIDFVAYCLNLNHYHFIVRQVMDRGIEKFMHRLATGYTMYFNEKEKRSGSLFQGVFKSVHINTDEYLLHLSAYVNLNDRVHNFGGFGGETSKIVKSISSWGEYMAKGNGESENGICDKRIILDQFRNVLEYKKYALESLKFTRKKKKELKEARDLLLE